MSFFSQVKMVLWGFIGLAPRDARGEKPPQGNFLVLLLVAVVLVFLFLGTLAFIAHTVVKG